MCGQNGSERGAKFGPFLKGPNWPHFIGAVLGSKFWPHFWGQNGPLLFTVNGAKRIVQKCTAETM